MSVPKIYGWCVPYGNAFKSDFALSDVNELFKRPERVETIQIEYEGGSQNAYAYARYATFTSNEGTVIRRELLS
jgi:hypothetical protein